MADRLRNTYLIGCAAVALVLQFFLFRNYGYGWDMRLSVFLALLLLNSNHQVKIYDDSVSINFPLLFPVIVFFGPGWASLFGSIGLISLDEFQSTRPVFLFNRGCLGLAAGLSALSFHFLGGTNSLLISLPIATVIYSFSNLFLFYIAKALRSNSENIMLYIREGMKTFLPSMTLAAMFYVAYVNLDVFGVLAAYYIFVTLRSGALAGHIEANYRISLIKSMLRAVYAKDHDLMVHLENVATYTRKLAKKCGYPMWKLQILDEASYFHDIGKLEISDTILKKTGRLSDEEWRDMRKHPERGMMFLKEIPLPKTHRQIVENIALYHHERYDGQGYPNGLSGDDIPLEARIVAVADTWDAMIGERCYRQPLPIPEAIAELRRVKGTQLDPQLVETFIQILDDEYRDKRPLMAGAYASSTLR